jgi:hypothetical protein
MAALPTIPHVVRTSVQGTLTNGQQWANVMHHNFTGGGWPAASDITALHAKVVRLYSGSIYTSGITLFLQCKNNVTLDRIVYTPLDGTAASTTTDVNATATETTDSLPVETALGITIRTGFRGRSYRGRMFLPAWCENQNGSDGRLPSGTATQLVNEFTGYQTDLGTANWTFGVASYRLVLFNSMTSVTVHREWHVIRRRRS